MHVTAKAMPGISGAAGRSGLWAGLLLLGAMAGCQSIGPATVPQDRLRYGDAVTRTTNEQMLLNLVRQRFMEPAVFLDVSNVVASYSFGAGGRLGIDVVPRARIGDTASAGIEASVLEAPTISYAPVTGDRLAKLLLRPIPAEAVFGLVASGARADFLLRLSLQSIGPWRNGGVGGAPRPADRAFDELIESFAALAQGGLLDLRRDETAPSDGPPRFVLALPPTVGPLAAHRSRIFEHLELDSGRSEFGLAVSSRERSPRRIAVSSRSLNALPGHLSSGVEIAPSDVEEGRATRRPAQEPPPMRVRSAEAPPAAGESTLVVKHRDRWYWIDDRDLDSKRSFMFLLMMASLVESGAIPQVPLLSLPTR